MTAHSVPAEQPARRHADQPVTTDHPPPDSLTAAGTGERARRARTEPMTLRPLRDGRLVVETDGGTYVVDTGHETCTCPDHAIRGARCKHLRRVAIEAAAGRVPPAGQRWGVCALCGDRRFVDADQPTALCAVHRFEPGELVVDRETGATLVVIEATTDRADRRWIDDDRRIADVESNHGYGAHEPVIEAVYAGSLAPAAAGRPKRYGFPAGRLVHTDGDPARGRRLLASHESARTADATG
ncbi:MAG: SWIM zinc finger family protein [Halohasta sp.]